jgi:hypothetical protein
VRPFRDSDPPDFAGSGRSRLGVDAGDTGCPSLRRDSTFEGRRDSRLTARDRLAMAASGGASSTRPRAHDFAMTLLDGMSNGERVV